MNLAADILLVVAMLILANSWRQFLLEKGEWNGAHRTAVRIVVIFSVVSIAVRLLHHFSIGM